MKSEQELDKIDADKAYWLELADAIGWTLAGWTDRRGAAFRHPSATLVVDIPASFRDSVMNAIANTKESF